MRLPYAEVLETLGRVLVGAGFEPERAELCARLFADSSRDGVYSHGLNRFPRFMEMVRSGVVDPRARAVRVGGFQALERWDGRGGAGNLNAHGCMERAIELSRRYGLGCVGLANTNHWMRGGSYGWQAAEAGVVGICWTNTMPNLPPWGAAEARIGNNPLVVAVPRAEGHVVLDMAMSQFSYGALESHRERGEPLPVPGGFDAAGELSRDAGAIEAAGRPLPIGYWKGSGLALMLDLLAALLSGGRATHEIPADPLRETGLSQGFIALDPSRLSPGERGDGVADRVVEHLKGGAGEVRYPGERTLQTRRENLERGIPVDPQLWRRVLRM